MYHKVMPRNILLGTIELTILSKLIVAEAEENPTASIFTFCFNKIWKRTKRGEGWGVGSIIKDGEESPRRKFINVLILLLSTAAVAVEYSLPPPAAVGGR